MGTAIVWLVNTVVGLFVWVVIANAILSWLVAFNVVNPRNGFVYSIIRLLEGLTDPLLRPLRRIIPLMGGIDISPIVLILGLQFALIVFNNMAAYPLRAALG